MRFFREISEICQNIFYFLPECDIIYLIMIIFDCDLPFYSPESIGHPDGEQNKPFVPDELSG